jgi:hypothetical protein
MYLTNEISAANIISQYSLIFLLGVLHLSVTANVVPS